MEWRMTSARLEGTLMLCTLPADATRASRGQANPYQQSSNRRWKASVCGRAHPSRGLPWTLAGALQGQGLCSGSALSAGHGNYWYMSFSEFLDYHELSKVSSRMLWLVFAVMMTTVMMTAAQGLQRPARSC